MSEVRITYTNHRGETKDYRIKPRRIWHGATPWHPERGWLLDAVDLDRDEERTFAIRDIRHWLEDA